MNERPRLFTIGHSNLDVQSFLALLTKHAITAIADVRSVPASRFSPHFNEDALRRSLSSIGVKYVFLGKELGARSDDPDCYVDGRVQYDRLAATSGFEEAVGRLVNGSRRERIAVMCSERDPIECHRTLLVAPALERRGIRVEHILSDGTLESSADATLRLRRKHGRADPVLFGEDEVVAEALSKQEARIAYVDPALKSAED